MSYLSHLNKSNRPNEVVPPVTHRVYLRWQFFGVAVATFPLVLVKQHPHFTGRLLNQPPATGTTCTVNNPCSQWSHVRSFQTLRSTKITFFLYFVLDTQNNVLLRCIFLKNCIYQLLEKNYYTNYIEVFNFQVSEYINFTDSLYSDMYETTPVTNLYVRCHRRVAQIETHQFSNKVRY